MQIIDGKKTAQDIKKEIAAEAWMLSCHKDGMNIVLNGEHKGKTLNEVLEIWNKSAEFI